MTQTLSFCFQSTLITKTTDWALCTLQEKSTSLQSLTRWLVSLISIPILLPSFNSFSKELRRKKMNRLEIWWKLTLIWSRAIFGKFLSQRTVLEGTLSTFTATCWSISWCAWHCTGWKEWQITSNLMCTQTPTTIPSSSTRIEPLFLVQTSLMFCKVILEKW